MNDMFKMFLVVLAGVFVVTGCADQTADFAAPAEKTVSVVVEPVQFSNALTRIEAVGTSRAIQSVTLSPVRSGEVVAVNFQPGQKVKKDEVLVQLDKRNEQLAVELANIRLADTKRLYERYQRTAGSGAILPTVLDAAKTAYETARVVLDQAMVALDDTVIKAPFDGYVGIAEINPGDRVNTGTVVTTIDNRNGLLISFEVPEIMVGTLIPGKRIDVSPWNEQTIGASGEVVDIGSRIDPLTRTFTVRARVENTDDQLRPGMSFRVRLDIEGQSFPVIPELSVQWGAEGSHVWVVSAGEAHRRPAIIIQRQQGKVLVKAELNEGELIVVEGVQRMFEGVKVKHTMRNEITHDEVDRTVRIES